MLPESYRFELSSSSVDELSVLSENKTELGSLAKDVLAVKTLKTLPYNRDTFVKCFGDADLYQYIRPERDYIYTSTGINILATRYLGKDEPIQYLNMRIARLLGGKKHTKLAYDLISLGALHASSILSFASEQTQSSTLLGEACRLMVLSPNYDESLVKQLSYLFELTCSGVGIGLYVGDVPLLGRPELGYIKTGFRSLLEAINSFNYVSLHKRKSKIAVYNHIHNDTIFECLSIKQPGISRLDNVFPALLVPQYFIDCLKADDWWYLFPAGVTTLNGDKLNDMYNDDYKKCYIELVEEGKYTMKIKCKQLMDKIIASYITSSGVYLINIDNVNKFNNCKHLGPIKTLNLCAEITNFANVKESSSCTLLSCNLSRFDVPGLLEQMLMNLDFDINEYILLDETPEIINAAKYVFCLGYFATVFLNNVLGDRKYREIGVSPLGMYDLVVLLGKYDSLKEYCSLFSEMLYKGAVKASCDFGIICDRWLGSQFSLGKPQWFLRGETPRSNWDGLCEEMKLGMANSLLTAVPPTATTANLLGCSESIMIPMNYVITKQSDSGRSINYLYFHMHRFLNKQEPIKVDNTLDKQILMYKANLPFCDHSQSTIYNIPLRPENILHIIKETFGEAKTVIYYIQAEQFSSSINTYKNYSDCDTCKL